MAVVMTVSNVLVFGGLYYFLPSFAVIVMALTFLPVVIAALIVTLKKLNETY